MESKYLVSYEWNSYFTATPSKEASDGSEGAITMWLDRFSGHSTPSGSPPPQNRSFSPAPKRPSHLGPGPVSRPGFSPRSSSLNVAKFNSSTASLSSPRLPNGSGLKQQITVPANSLNPLEVLEEIVGKHVHAEGKDQSIFEGDRGLGRPLELVEDIDFNGLGLHDFLEGPDDANGIRGMGILEGAEQSAEECEYVCPCGIADLLMLNEYR